MDAKLEELHSAAGEAEVTLEVKGDKAGMAGLGEDRVQMGQGGAGGVLKLVIRGVMGGGVAVGGGLSIARGSEGVEEVETRARGGGRENTETSWAAAGRRLTS